ncbi:MAG: hypothetical protein A3D31_06035 [Candidatus Fluviicola riflensis]|nr:MAG: hypothetical protein A3D31_06035 [Candidatus Fluviicola riflensis]OGS86953.1 MAG: hypothetical protein A2724_05495 [Fluviicola sp. RIFCSPHIGHO2_01_FULL_43_53]OGS89744.1 MAG: hypothetical protein A3E30_02240 [Fluviicola sp. RIFCSPHIGHO2_12_FULL_43_24]
MNLTGIIAISGKPGLFKVVAQGKNNIIVESLEEKKRFPAYSSDRISALDDISIYTYEEDKPLREIYKTIFEKENGGAILSHKEDLSKLSVYLLEVLPNYDQERVYPSDIKKLFQWYNLLLKAGELKLEAAESTETGATEETAATDKPKKEKAAAPKKAATAKKATDKPAAKSAPKVTAAKKVAAPKTGSSRGK